MKPNPIIWKKASRNFKASHEISIVLLVQKGTQGISAQFAYFLDARSLGRPTLTIWESNFRSYFNFNSSFRCYMYTLYTHMSRSKRQVIIKITKSAQ